MSNDESSTDVETSGEDKGDDQDDNIEPNDQPFTKPRNVLNTSTIHNILMNYQARVVIEPIDIPSGYLQLNNDGDDDDDDEDDDNNDGDDNGKLKPAHKCAVCKKKFTTKGFNMSYYSPFSRSCTFQ